jgi:hypothetical protein
MGARQAAFVSQIEASRVERTAKRASLIDPLFAKRALQAAVRKRVGACKAESLAAEAIYKGSFLNKSEQAKSTCRKTRAQEAALLCWVSAGNTLLSRTWSWLMASKRVFRVQPVTYPHQKIWRLRRHARSNNLSYDQHQVHSRPTMMI